MKRLFIFLSLLCALVAAGANAQQPEGALVRDDPAMPAGPTGAHIQALLVAVNANDANAVRSFILQHTSPAFQTMVPMTMHQQVFMEASFQSGGVDFRAIRTDPKAPQWTVVLVQDRVLGNLYELRLAFEPNGEQRLTRFQMRPAAPEPMSTRSEREAIDEIGAMLRLACDKGLFSGSALVARGATVLVESTCGEASKRYHVANKIDTRFNLGSMNKMFTAVVIAQLVEQGKLSYSDPIGKYVDDSWLPKSITDKVTIHQLLSHTSGLGSYFNEKFMGSSRALFRDLNDFKPLVRDEKLAFEPGARFEYSNTGMLLLGVVIEKVTGQSYFDVIRQRVYQPAGMLDSDSYAVDDPVPNLAMGYMIAPESALRWRENTFEHVVKGGPAGGGYSTVRDLHHFAMALQSGKLVKPETLQAMWKDQSGAGYGYGFSLHNGPAGKQVGHTGGFAGINSMLEIYADKGYIVTVMSNYSGGAKAFAARIGTLVEHIADH